MPESPASWGAVALPASPALPTGAALPAGPESWGAVAAPEVAPPAAVPEEPGLLQTLLRGFGSGAASLVGLPGEIGRRFTPPGMRHPVDVESVKNALTGLGIDLENPDPEDPLSRIVYSTGSGLGSSLIPVGRVPGLMRLLAGGTAAGAGAGVASEIAPESSIAPLVGAIAPAALAAGAGAATRGLVRVGAAGAARTAAEAEAFRQAGAAPATVGQATGRRAIQAVENLLGGTQGAGGVISRRAEAQQRGLGETVRGITGRTSAEGAGRTIRGAIEGPGGFLERFKAGYRRLDDEVGRYIPPETPIGPSSTVSALDRLTAPIAGAERVSSGLVNPRLVRIREQIGADLAANDGVISYQGLRELRSRIGKMQESSELITDIPRGELKQLYGALSEDMRAAARAAGSQAERAFERANRYYRSGRQRIDDTLQGIVSKVDPEDVYRAAMSGTKDGASTLRALKRSIRPQEFQVVARTAVDRLGRATPGSQDEIGDVFSSDTFLTNWNRMDPAAKKEILSGYDRASLVERSLSQVARVAANLKSGAKVYANPSGTSGALIGKVGMALPAGGLLVGGPAGALTAGGIVLGGMVAANLSARALTSPGLVNWIARATTMSQGELARHARRLSVIANRSRDEDEREGASRLLETLTDGGVPADGTGTAEMPSQ